MTVAEKLDAARVEAEDAAKSKTTTFKSKPPRSTNGDVKAAAPLGLDGAADAEQDDTLGTMNPVVKKTKKANRRYRIYAPTSSHTYTSSTKTSIGARRRRESMHGSPRASCANPSFTSKIKYKAQSRITRSRRRSC